MYEGTLIQTDALLCGAQLKWRENMSRYLCPEYMLRFVVTDSLSCLFLIQAKFLVEGQTFCIGSLVSVDSFDVCILLHVVLL